MSNSIVLYLDNIKYFVKLNFNSPYLQYANQTLSWLPMDTEERYQLHLKTHYEQLRENGWIDNSFDYRFNSYGFRCQEFNNVDNMMFLGCSLTVGIGIPEKNRWTDIIANKLNLRCFNLGIGGSSSDTAFRLFYGWIDKLKPKIVVFARPPGIRFEIVLPEKIEAFNVYYSMNDREFMEKWISDETNNHMNFLKNKLSIEYICKQKNIKFVFLEHPIHARQDLGRDLSHPGIISNKLFAESIMMLME